MNLVKKVVDGRLGGRSSSGGGSSGGSRGSGSTGSAAIELDASAFEQQVMGSDEPWLVEFMAPWCGHCQRLKPEWEKAAAELDGDVKFGVVDATQVCWLFWP